MTPSRLPKRPRAHVLGSVAELFVESYFMQEWIVRRISYDYGLDLNVELVKDGFVTGRNFSIQVKAVEGGGSEDYVSVRLKTSTLAYIRGRIEPVMLIVYVEADKEAYWIWDDELPIQGPGDTAVVRVPTSRPLTRTNLKDICDYVEHYFLARPRLDPDSSARLQRFGRYSIDLGRGRLLLKEEVDHLERLVNTTDVTERQLQDFIEQHPFVFLGGEYLRLHAQIRLEGAERQLIPDFLLEHVSGLCDVMEIKLPTVSVVAGSASRRRYSAGLHDAAAQTRVYRDFFDQREHRNWFENRYKIRAYKPRTILLIGRDSSFHDAMEKRELETALHDYRILTYDDLLRIARAQQVT